MTSIPDYVIVIIMNLIDMCYISAWLYIHIY